MWRMAGFAAPVREVYLRPTCNDGPLSRLTSESSRVLKGIDGIYLIRVNDTVVNWIDKWVTGNASRC